jgi:hypothetical protein
MLKYLLILSFIFSGCAPEEGTDEDANSAITSWTSSPSIMRDELLINEEISATGLTLSKSSGTIGGETTITFTFDGAAADSSKNISDYDIQFSSATGTISNLVISGNTVTAKYQNDTIGIHEINVIIDGKKMEGFKVVFETKPIMTAWQDSLPAVFSSAQAATSTVAGHARVAMDNSGNTVITWKQLDGTSSQIFKSEYRSGSWTHPSNLSDNISPDGMDVWDPKIAMDNLGNTVITWKQSDGTNQQIFKSEYRSGSWIHPSSLTDNISPDGQEAAYPQIAMNNSGNTVITWEQSDGAENQIFKSEYRSDSWTHPSGLTDNISVDEQIASSPQVAMDDAGNTVITWQQMDNVNKAQVFKSEYRSGSWTHPSSLTDNISPDDQTAWNQQVAMDNLGNTVITWDQRDTGGVTSQIFKSEYRSGSWTHPIDLTDNISPNGQHATRPQVAMGDSGSAVITWYQSDGTDNQIFKSE